MFQIGDMVCHYTEAQYIGIIIDTKADGYSVFWFQIDATFEGYTDDQLKKVS
jgi:hypothetical protein